MESRERKLEKRTYSRNHARLINKRVCKYLRGAAKGMRAACPRREPRRFHISSRHGEIKGKRICVIRPCRCRAAIVFDTFVLYFLQQKLLRRTKRISGEGCNLLSLFTEGL